MGATPKMNRSAEGGARSSLHYGDEGVLIHPPHQGVCRAARYGRTTRDLRRTGRVSGWHLSKRTYALQTTSEPELPARAGKSTADTYLLAVRCPAYRGRDSNLGFRTELENLVGDAKGKCTSGRPMRPKVPKHRQGRTAS